ncbi:MAG TPA: hypothetical protein VH813_06795 [Candidatus Limnocylindrales bacterium]|jgi:hypothetical protein
MTDTGSATRDAFSSEFETLAGWSAAGAALAGIAYAVAFVALANRYPVATGAALTLAPLLATPPLLAFYGRVRSVDAGVALLALVLGLGGSLGAFLHGGFDLANALHDPGPIGNFPSYADPRGQLTFGASGLALVFFAWLAGRTPGLPGWVQPIGWVLGVVLVVTWLGRLIVLDATSPFVLGPALVAGVLSPLFYLGLSRWLLTGKVPG